MKRYLTTIALVLLAATSLAACGENQDCDTYSDAGVLISCEDSTTQRRIATTEPTTTQLRATTARPTATSTTSVVPPTFTIQPIPTTSTTTAVPPPPPVVKVRVYELTAAPYVDSNGMAQRCGSVPVSPGNNNNMGSYGSPDLIPTPDGGILTFAHEPDAEFSFSKLVIQGQSNDESFTGMYADFADENIQGPTRIIIHSGEPADTVVLC